jgi:hypothetical protein
MWICFSHERGNLSLWVSKPSWWRMLKTYYLFLFKMVLKSTACATKWCKEPFVIFFNKSLQSNTLINPKLPLWHQLPLHVQPWWMGWPWSGPCFVTSYQHTSFKSGDLSKMLRQARSTTGLADPQRWVHTECAQVLEDAAINRWPIFMIGIKKTLALWGLILKRFDPLRIRSLCMQC